MKIQLIGFLILSGCATAPTHAKASASGSPFIACPQDPTRQKARSDELQQIADEDQKDRVEPVDWERVSPRDEARRKRVGEIFGEGCFKDAKDFAAAAIVFQHGVVPEHYFQTFLWAKKAVELGDDSQRWLMAAGLDRYLTKSGNKQLFATQASKVNITDECWCLEEVESTFPEKLRVAYAKKTLKQAMDWVDSLNQNSPICRPTPICQKNLKPSQRGTVPGFW